MTFCCYCCVRVYCVVMCWFCSYCAVVIIIIIDATAVTFKLAAVHHLYPYAQSVHCCSLKFKLRTPNSYCIC